MIPTGPGEQVAVGVVASFDFARDRELWRWVPPEVSLHISRTDAVPLDDSFALVSRLNDPAMLTRPTREVARVPIGARAVLYSCTAGSFVGGVDGERALRDAMTAAGAPCAVTTSGALVAALSALGAGRIAIAHPYVDPIAVELAAFLTEAGVEVLASHGLGLESRVISSVDYATAADLIMRGDHPDADAIFVACTLLPTYDLIAPLERLVGKPIITANQVGVWAALRELGVKLDGPGQHLARL
jgi:maleate isomerase